MANNTAKLVTERRVIELLACYGGDAANWPAEERAAAGALIKNSAELQRRQREAKQLDDWMGIAAVRDSLNTRPDPAIVANIVNALPEQAGDTAVDVLGRRRRGVGKSAAKRSWLAFSAVAMAATVVLTVGILLRYPAAPVAPLDHAPVRVAAASQDELDLWLLQEATGVDAPDAESTLAADQPLTYLAMLELELLPDNE